MELLTRQVDRVGVYRPMMHDTPDRIFELLRGRYRLTQDPATVHGMDYEEAAALQAAQGQEALTARLVDGYLRVAADYETVLIPSRLALSELAAHFGYSTTALPQNMTDYDGMRDYLHQRRLAFICTKGEPAQQPIQQIPSERRSRAPWWVTALQAKRAGRRGSG